VTPFIEACVLPAVFLTVTLAGAIRPGAAAATIVAPSPGSLVGAVVLIALMVRSGTLDGHRLVHASRPTLANLNGLSVLVTLFVSSATALTLVVPESGLPALVSWTVITALLAQALAMGPDRVRLLRGLLVTFGTAFVLKFIVLAALSTPAQSRVSQALQLLFDGLTLGSIAQRPPHPAEAYLAFGTLGLYLFGVAWLPSARWRRVDAGPPRDCLDAPPPAREIA
jgi:hypothetical protein